MKRSFRRHESVTLNFAKFKSTVTNHLCVMSLLRTRNSRKALHKYNRETFKLVLSKSWPKSVFFFYMEFFAMDVLSTCNTFLS